MKPLEQLLEENRKEIFEELKKEFLEGQDKAGDKKRVYDKQRGDFRDRVNKIYSQTSPFDYPTLHSMKEQQAFDKKVTFEIALQTLLKDIPKKDILAAVRKIAILFAYNDFSIYLGDYYKEHFYVPSDDELERKKVDLGIKWRGNNNTEFVQLIYALYEAQLLTNEKNEVTTLVEQLAEFFHFDLSDNWPTLLSTAVNERNYDYEPEIFKRIAKAYQSYSQRLKNKNQ